MCVQWRCKVRPPGDWRAVAAARRVGGVWGGGAKGGRPGHTHLTTFSTSSLTLAAWSAMQPQCTLCPCLLPPSAPALAKVTPLGAEASGTMFAVLREVSSSVAMVAC